MTITLAEKISLSCSRLAQIYNEYGSNVAVGWTGGKDSTVVLYLWRNFLAEVAPDMPVRAINVDTGCKFPEVLAFLDQWARAWNIDVQVARPDFDLSRYPLAADPISCCGDLKIKPLQAMISKLGIAALLTGVRADEHSDRAQRSWLEEYDDHLRALPILEWTELDIWTFHVKNSIPWCSLYNQGYRSLGCVPCTSSSGKGERSGRDSRKEAQMEQLRSLGYF